MSSELYNRNPDFGDFTKFYIVITVSTILGLTLFILNIVLGCCSRYSGYWNDRHTGNRWLVSLWTATTYRQPPLDYTELANVYVEPQQVVYQHQLSEQPQKTEYLELTKRESEI